MKRIARYLFWAFLLLLLVLVAGTGFLISTQPGLKALVALTDRIMPGQLTYDRLEGRLIGPLELENFHYQDGALTVDIARAGFDWKPSALLRADLRIDRLKADGIEVHLPESTPEEKPAKKPLALTDMRLPLQLQIAAVEITDIRLYPYGAAKPTLIEAIEFKAHTQNQKVVLDQLKIKVPQGKASLEGHLTPLGDYPLTLDLAWHLRVPDYGPVNGQGTLTGELLKTVSFTYHLSGIVTASLNGKAHQILDNPSWDTRLELTMTDLGQFSPDLKGSGLSAQLRSQGTLNDFQASAKLNSNLPEIGQAHINLDLSGNRQAIQISQLALSTRESPMMLTAKGHVDLTEQRVSINGHWQSLVWPLQGQPEMKSPQGHFSFQGTSKDYNAQLKADLSGSQSGELQAVVEAAGTDQAIQISTLSLRAPKGELAVNAQARLSFADLSFNASGEWQSLAWPLIGTPRMTSPKGNFKASGSLENYSFRLDTIVQGSEIPRGDWHLQGEGSKEALKGLEFNGKLLEGELQGNVSARWQPDISWQVKVTGNGLNPGVQWPEMPGKLALALQTQGELTEAGPKASLSLDNLSGTLSGQTIRGNAQAMVKGQNFTIQTLQLNAGNARLAASGSLDQRWDIRWKLEVPKLHALIPDMTGTINSSGNLTGPRKKPRGDLQLSIKDLAYNTTTIQRLKGTASIDVSGDTRSRLDFTGSGLDLAGQAWDTLSLKGSGTPTAHNLEASLKGELGRFAVALDGALKDELWQGRLTRLSAKNTEIGDWILERPVSLRASSHQARIEQTCLSSRPSQICAQGQWTANSGAEGRLTLDRLTVEQFASFLPENITIDTSLSGEMTGGTRPDGTITGQVNLKLTPGSLRLTANGSPVQFNLGGGYLQAESNGHKANAALRLDMGRAGQITGDLQATDLADQPRLNGKINAEIQDLGVVSAFAPQLQNISGRALAHINLSGNLPVPVIQGEIRLVDGAANVPPAGIRIEDLQLAAISNNEGILNLSGSAQSGSGQIKLSGRADLANNEFTLQITGKQFQAFDTSDIRIQISPDLKVALDQQRVEIDGQITIPQAYLSPPQGGNGGEGAVGVSQDVVIVDERQGETNANQPGGLKVYAKIRIILGDEVRVQAFGFKGQLQGNLLVEQSPQMPPSGNGTVQVAAGDYKIYGQELKIQKGRVLFSGGPIDNPGLDLRVEREVDDVTVGAQVSGTLRSPRLELFSNPAMPDSSILSYLVLGQAPGETSDSENALLFQAAATLALKGSNPITGSLSKAVGLDTFKFESGTNPTNEASLVLGKYLTPDLYVSYGIGLFEAVDTFKLRYELKKNLTLESSSSTSGTSADLIYTIER